MWPFDLFSRLIDCPECGQASARRSLFGKIRCPNPACSLHDANLARLQKAASGGLRYRDPRTGQVIVKEKTKEAFAPGSFAIEIAYTNFRGEEKTFVGDGRTLRRKGNHFSIRCAPTGRRLALARERIRNLQEIEDLARRLPTRREQVVLAFHKRRGSTSALYESLRRRYPDW